MHAMPQTEGLESTVIRRHAARAISCNPWLGDGLALSWLRCSNHVSTRDEEQVIEGIFERDWGAVIREEILDVSELDCIRASGDIALTQ